MKNCEQPIIALNKRGMLESKPCGREANWLYRKQHYCNSCILVIMKTNHLENKNGKTKNKENPKATKKHNTNLPYRRSGFRNEAKRDE